VFRFADPQHLYWLWAIAAYAVMSIFWEKYLRKKLLKSLGDRVAPVLTASLSLPRRRWKLGLQVLGLSFLLLAWARPQVGSSVEEIKSEGIELILLVDVSASMMAEDVKPSRLDFAKRELDRFLGLLGGDKVGIVGFAGSAALVSPMTSDKTALRMFLEGLSTDTVSTQGTDFSRALEEAVDAFKRGGVEADETTKVTRAIIIASDGEDNEEGAIATARNIADKDGIRIFSLAFGTERGAPVPMRDQFGNLQGYKKDESGATVLSRTKGTILKNISNAGKGSFYHVTHGGNHVRSLRNDLDQLEKTAFSSDLATNYDEKFQYFLFLGLVILIIEMFFLERRSLGHLWKGRFEVVQ
jgi:Ca-activated chloride channel family protein